jgi:hypothetical protein
VPDNSAFARPSNALSAALTAIQRPLVSVNAAGSGASSNARLSNCWLLSSVATRFALTSATHAPVAAVKSHSPAPGALPQLSV